MPVQLRDGIQQEEVYGKMTGTRGVVYRLPQLVHPQGLQEQDEVLRRLTSPNPCREPQAALTELRRWLASMARAETMGVALPGVELLYRGAHSIYASVLETDDVQLRLRWFTLEASFGYPHMFDPRGASSH